MIIKTLVFFLTLVCVSGYKILVIAPLPIRSMNILGVGYVRHLLKAGHEVTYASAFPLKDKPQNFTQIDLSSTHRNLLKGDTAMNLGYLISQPLNEYGEVEYIQAMGAEAAEHTYANKEMLALLNDPSVHFDAVIADYMESEMYAALAAYYDCPMIWAYSLGSHWNTLRLVDEPTNPAYATDYLTSDIPPLHSMSQRVNKLWMQIQWYYYKWFKTLPREKRTFEKVFAPLFLRKNKRLPDYNEVIYNASLVLANDFPGNGPITSVPQNFKFVGGYHILTPIKPLPKELQALLDITEHGFIYFSMGSLWKAKDIPKHITQGLLDLFVTLKETVIWKYEDKLPSLPKNVHTVQWAPQQSILAHPKCLFFISHGGLLSTTESVHLGVATIGIPVYFDQFINVNRGVQFGRTIRVDLTLNLVEDLRAAIQKMIQDPSYKKQAKELSKIYHDRPVAPGVELVHWVEHVVRTRGAPHLRSPASLMPWWEKLHVDILLISLTIALFIRYLFRKYLRYNKTIDSHKKKN